MSDDRVCPECRNKIPADAPGGLCPNCRTAAAMAHSRADETETGFSTVANRTTGGEFSTVEHELLTPAATVGLDQFKQAVLDLGLISPRELERIGTGASGGVPGLARALVAVGKLTSYQAAALTQGKSRGLVIGNYFILEKLGEGGMGVVFKARHRRLGRIVALKILPPSLARDPVRFSRFRREVDVAAKLSHPNIVGVLDADADRGVQFMTMEYIEGTDLDRLVSARGALPVNLALDYAIQAARGLEAAHAQGIVHRDIKPANLMLDQSGTVRVLDLGLARLVEASNPFDDTTSGPLTASGMYMGTVDFMAPEQSVDSRRVDHRADIYSLACTLCYLLTGRPPFEGANVLARLVAHQQHSPKSLRALRPEVPQALDTLYGRMMAKEPADRASSMSEVVKLLEETRPRSVPIDHSRLDLPTTTEKAPSTGAGPTGTLLEKTRFPRAKALKRTAASVATTPDKPVDRVLLEHPTNLPGASPIAPGLRTSRWKPSSVKAVAFGALALLGLGALGIWLVPRDRGRFDRDNLAGASSDTAGGHNLTAVDPSNDAATAHGASSAPGALDVATLFVNLGLDQRAIAVTADGRHALVGGGGQYADVLSIDRGFLERSLYWQSSAISGTAITPDGRFGLVGTYKVGSNAHLNQGGTFRCWDLKTGKLRFPLKQPYRGDVTAVAISSDGLLGLSGGEHGELDLWDLNTGQNTPLGRDLGRISAHALAFFPDGHRAASGGQDKRVHIWDIDKRRELAAWTGHDGTISGLAISADGRHVLSGSRDSSMILWSSESGAILHRFDMPGNDSGMLVAFSSEGNIVSAAGGTAGPPARPGNLSEWDARSFALLRRDERPFARHLALASLPGGRLLTGDDYAIRVWTPRPPEAVAKQAPKSTGTHDGPVNLIALIGREPLKTLVKWAIEKGDLVSPPNTVASLVIPFAVPSDYRIDMTVELTGKESDNPLKVGLSVAGRHTEISIDTIHGESGRRTQSLVPKERYTGLNGCEGRPNPFGQQPYHGQLLFRSRPVRLSATVTPGSIRITCDGSLVVDWTGDPKSLIPYHGWRQFPGNSVFLHSYSAIRIHEMTLTPLVPTPVSR
jgi:serine/threonine protein kinase/WD40 repeat protein